MAEPRNAEITAWRGPSKMDDKPYDEQVEEGGLKHIKVKGDNAAQFLEGADTFEWTAQEEKSLLRKCDWILVPTMACGTAFSYIDKIALGNAATLTLVKDLHLVGQQYSLLTTIYYIGLITAQWPANLLLQRFHTGRVMAIGMFCWGAVTLGCMGVKNFSQMAALRFLLAVFESVIVPGQVLTTSRFYKPTEVPIRIAFWTLANTLMPIPFSVIYYGLGHLPAHPLEQWRWIYCLLGVITVCLACVVLLVIPDQPANCWWLKERQRLIIVKRAAPYQVGQKSTHFKWAQVREAVTDPRAILLSVALCCQQSGASVVTNFSGLITKGLGFTGLQALILQIPGWVCSSGLLLVTGVLGTYTTFFRTRKTLILMVSCLLAIASLVVLIEIPPGQAGANKGLQLFFLSLLNGHTGAYSGLVTLGGQNFAGTTKRSTVLAMNLIGFSLSNMLVPLSFKSSQSPRYPTGIHTVISLLSVCFCCYVGIYITTQRENARRDRLEAAGELPAEDPEAVGLADLTDRENLRFRYYA